jgi:hypothetical protein
MPSDISTNPNSATPADLVTPHDQAQPTPMEVVEPDAEPGIVDPRRLGPPIVDPPPAGPRPPPDAAATQKSAG